MANSKSSLSVTTVRAPFQPATRLVEIPIVLYEILELAAGTKIEPLIRSVIEIAEGEPGAWVKLREKADEKVPVGALSVI